MELAEEAQSRGAISIVLKTAEQQALP